MIFSSSSSSSLMDQEELTSKKPKHSSGGGGGASSLEVAKRPRGRPLGSKNKPRPPTIFMREPEPSSSAAMRPHLLEIAPGSDIVASLSAFSARRSLGLCVLAATGSVSNVTLRQPEGRALALRGSFEILSMSAAFLTPGGVGVRSPPVTILLAGPGGRVVGGTVVGPVVAAGTAAMVVAAGFGIAEFNRLPDADEDDVLAGQHEQQEEDGDRDDFDTTTTAMNSRGMEMEMEYSSHLPAESIWPLGPAMPRHYSS